MTLSPTASTRPPISCPGTRGYWSPGHRPSLTNTSLWQIPHASTFTRTCPAPGSGISRSTNSTGFADLRGFHLRFDKHIDFLSFLVSQIFDLPLIDSQGVEQVPPARCFYFFRGKRCNRLSLLEH